MIIPDSEMSGSSVRSGSGRSPSFGPVDDPPSPPPYSTTIASSDDHYQSADSPRSPNFPTTSTRGNLPPRCNHLVDRKTFSSVSGTWHVDTALEIPESLLPPLTEFDGRWNREAQQARKTRADELRRRQEWSPRWDRPASIVERRPNLMLGATNGAISGDVHVVSSDGLARQAIFVAEGCNGSISLRIHAPQHQLLRVFASSTNGSVNIKVPSSFEGAIVMSTSWGSANISPAIKAKLTTFSTSSNSSRGFVGNWEAQGFGASSDPNDDPPLPAQDPFLTWTGPLIDISSTNGAVNLSFIEEEADSVTSHFTKAFHGFMGGWFGKGRQGENVGCGGPPALPMFTPPPPPMFHPSPPSMFFPPPPGAWPGMNPVKSAGVGGLDLD